MTSSSLTQGDSTLLGLPEIFVAILATHDASGKMTIVSTESPLGVASHRFLSPFDTFIESAYHGNGFSLDMLHFSQVNWRLFEVGTRRALIGNVHMAGRREMAGYCCATQADW